MKTSVSSFVVKSAAVAAVLAATSLNASAMTILGGPITGSSFSDVTIGTISVGSISDVTGSLFAATNVTFPAPFNFTLTLDQVTFTSGTVGALTGDLDATASGFHFMNVASGNYIVKASGTLNGLGQYPGFALVGANYSVTPVPEPETYALMLAGLGIIGFVASRRKVS
ncbi:MAG: FxDxF family PEP-CTERM protein [Burkholderiales bacterium]|jgi:hypothetical protein